MKEFNVNFSKTLSDLICFEAKFYQNKYTFLINKNFKAVILETLIKRQYFHLEDNLNLKYFKMEIIKKGKIKNEL